MPSSSEITIYTEHGIKPLLTIDGSGTNGSTSNATYTVVKGWMKGTDKRIAGMQFSVEDNNNDGTGVEDVQTFSPSFNSYYQDAANNGTQTGFSASLTKTWDAQYFQYYEQNMLIFDKVSNAIGNGSSAQSEALTYGNIYNFYKANFSISSVKAANAYGNLISVGTDVFTEQTPNDHVTLKSTNSFVPTNLAAFKVESVLEEQRNSSASYSKVNQFMVDRWEDGGGLKFMTENWGTGVKLVEGYLTQNRDIYSVNKGTATLGQLTYEAESGYSNYKPAYGNAGGNSEIQFDVGAADTDNNMPGWSGTSPAELYFHVDTSDLSGTVKDVDLVKGKYILPSTCNVSMSFIGESSAVDKRRFTISNMTTSFTASQQTVNELSEIKYGAKIKLTFTVNTTGFNQPYKAEGTNKVSTTKSSEFVYVNNVVRSRTDPLMNKGTLFAQGDITILGEDDKLKVSTTDLIIHDTYALYFNATYEYTSFMFNVITGEYSDDTQTVHTKPGRVRNIQDKTVTDVAPGVYLEWDDHPATGGYSTLSYDLEMENLKITGETFKPDGTAGALDGGDGEQETAKDLTSNINKTETGIQNREFDIKDNRYLPGLQNAFQLYVKAKNSNGQSSESKQVTNISCLEAAETKESSVSFTMLSCQNPIKLAEAEGDTPSQPVIGDSSVYATHLSLSAGDIPSVTTDSFGNNMDYETNFIRLHVTPYSNFTNEVATYIVYAFGRKVGTVTKADMDANSNVIVVSKIPTTAYNYGKINNDTVVCFDIIAVSTNDVYTKRTEKTKIIKSLEEPAYPPPVAPMGFSVTNKKTTDDTQYYNKVEISFTALPNNRISYYKIYQIKVGSDFVVESETISSYTAAEITAVVLSDFTDGTVMKEVLQVNNNNVSGNQTVTIEDGIGGARLYDNQIVAYALLAFNKDGIAATSVLPTAENLTPADYTDILYASGQASDADYVFSNANCIQQTKTNPPKKMEIATISTSAPSYGNFSIQAIAHTPRFENYSSDQDLRYTVSYKPVDDVFYGTALIGGYSVIVSGQAWSKGSSSVSYTYSGGDFAPDHKFQFKVTAATDLSATTSSAAIWTADTGKETPAEDNEDEGIYAFKTKKALYVGKIGDNYDAEPNFYSAVNKPCLYPEELIIVRGAGSLKVKHQQFPPVQYTVSGVIYMSPPSSLVGWKWDGASAVMATQIKLSSSQNITLNEGDILTVYNTYNGATLDSVVVTGGMADNPSLIIFYCSTVQNNGNSALTGNFTRFAYSIWRVTGQYYEKLNLVSVKKFDKNGDEEGAVTDIANMTALADGPMESGTYQEAVYSVAPVYYNIYENGKYKSRVTRSAAINDPNGEYTVLSEADDNSYSNYTVTQSYNESNGSEYESNPAYMTAPTKNVTTITNLQSEQLVTSLLSSAYSTSHVVKAIYADSHDAATEGLYLNNDATQTQTLDLNNAWSFVSFSTVDTDKTTYEDLFDEIFTENENVTRIQIFTQYEALITKSKGAAWDGYMHDNDVGSNKIEYDKGIFVNVQGQDTTSYTITGKRVRGMKMSLALGSNYVGYPLVTSSQVESKEVFAISLETGGEGAVLWDILYKFQGSKKEDSGVNIVNTDNTTSLEDDYGTGQAFFNSEQGHLVFTTSSIISLPNSFNFGTMASQGLIGDFDSSGTLDTSDVSIYGQFLAQKLDGYTTINALSDAEKKDIDFNKNTVDDPTLDIGDAVILLSKVVHITDNSLNSSFSTTAGIDSNLTNFKPTTYKGPPGSQP